MDGGQQDIFVSANNKNKNPNKESYDFSTLEVKGGNYTNGKSLILSYLIL